jgi:phosphotransferase system enzyme I (PtsP)
VFWLFNRKTAREFNTDEIYALEVVAMVLAEMAELGAFVSEESGLKALHQQSILIRGSVAQEGATKGNVWLHEPRVVVTNLVSDDPEAEISRLEEAVQELRKPCRSNA